MQQQTANQTMFNSNQPNETTYNKPCTTVISLMRQQITNQTINNSSQRNKTTDNKPNHVQQHST